MKFENSKEYKCYAFDSFCKKILKNETRNYNKELNRRRKREVLFTEMSTLELAQLHTTDVYFLNERIFTVLDYSITVKNETIAEALRRLPKLNCNIILLYYFIGLTDNEIGSKFNLIRATVQYKRISSLKKLKNIIEEQLNE